MWHVIYYIFLLCGYAWASENEIPKHLQEYIDNAEHCLHFAEEWDSDLPDEQKKEIKEGVDQYCTKVQELRSKLKKKYKDDIKKIEIINNYDI
ncbi:conserved hypothetical protein; putative exported protein [Xenorhabdus nematophila ATCC 19061]|uniref:Uncharacterized protein n=1 Tax=Xenorhabdus nematophila (strain ATCC 19061 / DSM 3370 / CCUG 14189 / LMG 1036 / NCIMB 9965 / AN6) TaxID=406817 RepID=D3VI94_XENNA|nr:hypothetical protein [Xenorhabdus nematophila]CBJ90734.1 conserved hypothetical protein; putative exported protein [Xenorhabdus nematophila ATCC 19061]CEK23571.1 conserved hypothetical protein; putative exported protein [Xenorhabdus nematophila AN6/1]